MKHRVLLPVLLKLINSQAAEQLAPTAEISVKCACQKALAETAGPGKKHILIFLGYIKDIPGLVNVKPGSSRIFEKVCMPIGYFTLSVIIPPLLCS